MNGKIRIKTKRNREVPVMFYVSQEEKDQIVEKAKNLDMSISDYCRKVLTGRVKNV